MSNTRSYSQGITKEGGNYSNHINTVSCHDTIWTPCGKKSMTIQLVSSETQETLDMVNDKINNKEREKVKEEIYEIEKMIERCLGKLAEKKLELSQICEKNNKNGISRGSGDQDDLLVKF